jgi:hypothetical protein
MPRGGRLAGACHVADPDSAEWRGKCAGVPCGSLRSGLGDRVRLGSPCGALQRQHSPLECGMATGPSWCKSRSALAARDRGVTSTSSDRWPRHPPTPQGALEVAGFLAGSGAELNEIVVLVAFGRALIDPYHGFTQRSASLRRRVPVAAHLPGQPGSDSQCRPGLSGTGPAHPLVELGPHAKASLEAAC